MNKLEARLSKLERENRRFKVGALVLLALAGAGLLMGSGAKPAVSDEVRARKLVVVDEAGNERVEIGAKRNESWLSLYDGAGVERVGLGTSKDAAGLSFLDEAGELRVGLGATKHQASVSLYDEARTQRASLSVRKDGAALALYDEEKNVIWEAPN